MWVVLDPGELDKTEQTHGPVSSTPWDSVSGPD